MPDVHYGKGSTIGTVRLSAADDPEAQNPGALTRTELLLNPDSAAANRYSLQHLDYDEEQPLMAGTGACLATSSCHERPRPPADRAGPRCWRRPPCSRSST